jgi:hypothetical protein
LLIIILILPYVSYIHLSGSPYSVSSTAEHIIGDLTLRFKPDESIRVRLKAEGIQLDEELGILRPRIKSEAEGIAIDVCLTFHFYLLEFMKQP